MKIHCCSAVLRLDLVDFVVDFLFVVDLVVVDLVFVAPVFSLLAGTRFLGKIPTVEPALPYRLARGGGRSQTSPSHSPLQDAGPSYQAFHFSLSLDSQPVASLASATVFYFYHVLTCRGYRESRSCEINKVLFCKRHFMNIYENMILYNGQSRLTKFTWLHFTDNWGQLKLPFRLMAQSRVILSSILGS